MPDGAPNLHSFRLVGKYDREPIRAADEKFSYYAVQVKGDFDSATVKAAVEMGRVAVQRYGISLARPGQFQTPRRLGPDRYLVLVAYDASRGPDFESTVNLPLMFDMTGANLLTLGSPYDRLMTTTLDEKCLGGFHIPFSVWAGPGFELRYTVGLPH